MPIRAYLGGQKFDGETIRLMGVAFEQSALLIHLDGAAVRRAAKPPKSKRCRSLIAIMERGVPCSAKRA